MCDPNSWISSGPEHHLKLLT